MTGAVNRKEWGQYGPAMRAISPRWRSFVEFYLLEPPGHGAQTRAVRRAGYGKSHTKPADLARIALKLMRDQRIVDAIAEESRKVIRCCGPEAAKALINLVRDPEHKDHARGIAMVLARVDPEVTTQNINVVHSIDPDTEAVEELRALRHLGTHRDKLLELFGPNGLERVERLEALRRSEEAKVISGSTLADAEGEVING
jgi:hypothetical protein